MSELRFKLRVELVSADSRLASALQNDKKEGRAMNLKRSALVALAWLASAMTAHAALPPGISGSWYNPEQSGHGLTVEVLDTDRAFGGWYVYDHDGNPINLYLEGVIEGTTIRSQAFVASGLRFGSFDPRNNRVDRWGTVTLAFSDCDTGTLSWNADGVAGAGYGSGSMPVKRLTRVAGVGCQISGLRLPAGIYSGSADLWLSGRAPLHGAVDSQGRLWAVTESAAGSTYVSSIPPPPAFFGYGAYEVGGGLELSFDVLYAIAMANPQHRREGLGYLPVPFVFGPAGTVSGARGNLPNPHYVQAFEFAYDPRASQALRQPGFDPASLRGRTFQFFAREQFFGDRPYSIRFVSPNRFCIDFAPGDCAFDGRVGAVDPGLAMFDVEIVDEREFYGPGVLRFAGKAWLMGPNMLAMVTRDPLSSFAVIASER